MAFRAYFMIPLDLDLEPREHTFLFNARNPPPTQHENRWEMECTALTDAAGRLVQQESYVDGNGGYTFDPRDVFQGEGGGIGGRGGGRGDGTTLPDAAGTSAEGGTEEQEEVSGTFVHGFWFTVEHCATSGFEEEGGLDHGGG